MSKLVIEVKGLTKDFGANKGIFNLNFNVKEGEMVGFVGTNGSGKTTTIRTILGFIKPDAGEVSVYGYNAWKDAEKYIKDIGYVPGEIAFPDLKTGTEFLRSQATFLGIKDLSYANSLISLLKLDTDANLKRMSKGMKQKTALVAALMHNPKILVLDEPTTGLDPLMRSSFMDIVKEEHKKGKTILMSSQSFEELESTCDRVIFLLDGKIVSIANIDEIRNRKTQEFKIEFINEADYLAFKKMPYTIIRDQEKYYQVTVSVNKEKIHEMLKAIAPYKIKFISEIKYTLEHHFKEMVRTEEHHV